LNARSVGINDGTDLQSTQFVFFLVSLVCMLHTDLKSLIAYSSVAHTVTVIGGIATTTYCGFCGYFTLIIALGLCSSGLFCSGIMMYMQSLMKIGSDIQELLVGQTHIYTHTDIKVMLSKYFFKIWNVEQIPQKL
jgi:NADH:ubiquinone oxidoreductase subunit 4 (subunit M)